MNIDHILVFVDNIKKYIVYSQYKKYPSNIDPILEPTNESKM